MKRKNIQEIDKMGRKLAKKCINESRRRILAESDNWRNNHMGGTVDNTKEYERWRRMAHEMGYSPQYIDSIGELNSWVGGGAEKNGLIDWSSGWPVLKQDAYAEFANGDNNLFKRNNAAERNQWFDERARVIGQEEAMRNANPYGMPSYGMTPYGPPAYGTLPYDPPAPPSYGGGSDDDIFRYMMLNDYMRAQDVARNEAAAHPEKASGAPLMNQMLPLLMLGGRGMNGGRPSYGMTPPYGDRRPPHDGGMIPPYGDRRSSYASPLGMRGRFLNLLRSNPALHGNQTSNGAPKDKH